MDSLTQIVLGAAVGEATVGHKIGRKAALYGAVLGTLPDLDVLWVKNAVDSFTEHRSFSHSLIILFLISPLLAWLFQRWHPISLKQQTISFKYWMFSVYLILATHPILDWFTVYGTQLLWPLTKYPFGLGSVFIIDPAYTLPFLICLLLTVFTRKRLPLICGFVFSITYLLWSLTAQQWQTQRFAAALQHQGIETTQTMTLPMPLNTLLWKNIAVVDGGYWVSFSSVFDDKNSSIKSRFFKSDIKKLDAIKTEPAVQQLRYFTKGFYQIKQHNDDIWFSDLRMGGFGDFVFNFSVGQMKSSQVVAVEADQIKRKSLRPSKQQAGNGISIMWQRIFDEEVDLFHLFDGAEMLNK